MKRTRKVAAVIGAVGGVATVALMASAVYLYAKAPATITAEPVSYSVVHHPSAAFYALVVVMLAVGAVAIGGLLHALFGEG